MFSFLAFRNWIHRTLLFKFLFSWYRFIFTTSRHFILTTNNDSILPNEIITDIFLRLPTKSLLKCKCVSKSWHQLISSPDFVNIHLKLNKHHTVLFPGYIENIRFCSLPHLFNKQHLTQELLYHMVPPCSPPFFVGSVNGLICFYNRKKDTYIWNPTIRKSKKLLKSSWGISRYIKFGFGYDESRNDYKVVFIDHCGDSNYGVLSNLRVVVNIYSSRTDSWTTLHDPLKEILLLNYRGKFINGKIYWAASTGIHDYYVRNIIYFDVASDTWGSLELPVCGEEVFNIKLGVVDSELSVLYTCKAGTTSDVWILKDRSVNVSWMKQFTIEYPLNAVLFGFDSPVFTFSIYLNLSDNDDILLLMPGKIMIFDGSTKKFKHTTIVKECNTAEIYGESMVNPLSL
ncbi:F-box/kelch-repeat protein At3g23880-like [Solanum pennellii]|uniref:F-box/kelch-repeat protein At3g23880-like n=1 Tax=Solanum pennellii TaxID=28526 RepID=A0ABM1GSH6_SOLPN|nr:F-box/kelch-repeat protein At3g23880-like [Solanum pennellii]